MLKIILSIAIALSTTFAFAYDVGDKSGESVKKFGDIFTGGSFGSDRSFDSKESSDNSSDKSSSKDDKAVNAVNLEELREIAKRESN